jgi:hypothetical protein
VAAKGMNKGMFRKRKKPTRTKPEFFELSDIPEQLTLNI